MPELPEVETTVRALRPVLEHHRIRHVVVRHHGLRWPVSRTLPAHLDGRQVRRVWRRAKYILVEAGEGTLIIHLGMTGSFRILAADAPAGAHDHVDIVMAGGRVLRYTDPRRFGAFVWTTEDPALHKLLKGMGPEPWDTALTAASLRARAEGRKVPVKGFIMDNAVVVGVGNIYANEALFRAGIHPLKAAGRLSLASWERLLGAIREILAEAIRVGGTTVRNFSSGDGKPGYFVQKLAVYGRAGQPCRTCGTPLKEVRVGGRSTVYCGRCQR